MRVAVNGAILDGTPSGLGTYTMQVSRALAAAGADVLLYASAPGVSPGPRIEVRPAPAWAQLGRGFPGYLRWIAWTNLALKRRIPRDRPDVLLAPGPTEALLRSPVLQIIVMHDCIPLRFPASYPQQYRFYRYAVPRLLRRAGHVVAVSGATAADLRRYYPDLSEARVTVVHNGLDWKSLGAAPPSGAGVADGPYLLAVGNLLPHKNLERLIDAFARLPGPSRLTLTIVGRKDRRFYPRLRAHAEAAGVGTRVRFAGYVGAPALAGLYRGARALVHPSLSEGFGLPPLEAMACATPALVSRIPALEEVCGDAALYFDPEDPAALTAALASVLEDGHLRERLARAGPVQAKQYTWERTAGALLDLFEGLAAADRR
ncbi:MAG: glycosyltransferase family 4 protein [Candidatus Rokubacteria bacterium]|nr:glycosyltransferase family 4 protein [Candidatus Rokubacteria bacterium]